MRCLLIIGFTVAGALAARAALPQEPIRVALNAPLSGVIPLPTRCPMQRSAAR